MSQLDLFDAPVASRTGGVPDICRSWPVIYVSRHEHVIFPATQRAEMHEHTTVLYLTPAGVIKLEWWRVRRRQGPATSVKTWYLPAAASAYSSRFAARTGNAS